MKQLSNSDYNKILRILGALSKMNGQSLRERENVRKATLLHKKLMRKEQRDGNKCNPREL